MLCQQPDTFTVCNRDRHKPLFLENGETEDRRDQASYRQQAWGVAWAWSSRALDSMPASLVLSIPWHIHDTWSLLFYRWRCRGPE